MAITTPSMGLKRWDQPNDIFSYVELSDNFAQIDVHDHSSGKGVQIPTAGIVNSAIDATKLADNAVTANKVAAGALADTKLASPNNGVWRTVAQAQSSAAAGLVAQRYYLSPSGALLDGLATGGAILPIVPFDPTWYSVTGKTTQLRILTIIATNAVAPASNFTFGLYPITASAGGATAISYTGGVVVSGSTALHTTPAATARSTVASAAFTAPATGVYAIGFVSTATLAASSFLNAVAYLQIAHI